jgi:hypothetical protein
MAELASANRKRGLLPSLGLGEIAHLGSSSCPSILDCAQQCTIPKGIFREKPCINLNVISVTLPPCGT